MGPDFSVKSYSIGTLLGKTVLFVVYKKKILNLLPLLDPRLDG